LPIDYLINEAWKYDVEVHERDMVPTIKGLYADKVIWINRNIPTESEKCCILAEELGHYHTSHGNILDQSNLNNRKQEQRARNWAYEQLISLNKIVQAYEEGVSGRFELAEHLQVTEQFLQAAIDRYRDKYGSYVYWNQHIITFDPLDVQKIPLAKTEEP